LGNQTEQAQCDEVRKLFESIDWPCEVQQLVRIEHLSARESISGAITWFFETEKHGIILEDDCVPSQGFFRFAEELLERYADDKRIGMISGNNFQFGRRRGLASYYFSRYSHIWGWATWARAWKAYRERPWTWPRAGYREYYSDCGQDEFLYWERVFSRVRSGEIHSWDYPWISSFWRDGLVSITPAQNLVRNVGFGADATNTQDETAQTGMEREGFLNPPFTGPNEIRADVDLDRQTFQNHMLRQEGRLTFWPRILRSIMKRVGFLR
jgi:hypothetical protein